MKPVKLFEEYINEASVTPKEVGRDTGVKLNIKSIKKQLEKDGYVVRYDNDSSMVNPKGINVFNPDSGHTLTIRRNGELFGDDNWGTEISSEKEVIKALGQYEKELSESVNESIDFDGPLYKKVLKAIAATKTYMEVENEDDMSDIFLSTRENGDVGSETPGREDIKEAQRVQKILQKKFAKDDIKVTASTTDEWVNLHIQKLKPIEYKYGYRLYTPGKTGLMDDQGGDSFYTFEELVDYLEAEWDPNAGPGYHLKGIDWKAVKKELDSITEFPRDEFVGWHRSKPILLARVGEFNNKSNDDIYLIKKRSDQ